MDSDAGSSLARRRHHFSSLFSFVSSFYVSLVHSLQVYLLYLGFFSSSFAKSCASVHPCHIQASWLLLLICSPDPVFTAALDSDLTFDGDVCTALSRSPKIAVQSDLCISSSSWAMTSLPTGKNSFSLSRYELSFLADVHRCLFARSTSISCSDFCSSTSVANQTLPKDSKINPLSLPLPFTAAKPGVCSYFLSKTDSCVKWFNCGFINAHWLLYGNIGVRSLFLATASASLLNPVKLFCFYTGVKVAQASSSNSFILHRHLLSEALYTIALSHMSPHISRSRLCSVPSPNLRFQKLQPYSPLKLSFLDKITKTSSRHGRERSITTSSFSQERIFPPQSLFLRDDPLPVFKTGKIYQYPSRLLSYVKVHLGPVDAAILIQMGVEVLDCVVTSHTIVTNRPSFADFEERSKSFIYWIASGIFNILYNVLSNFNKFVSLSLFYVVLYAWKLAFWLAHRVMYDVASYLVIA